MSTSKPAILSCYKCRCEWGKDCTKQQQTLADHCMRMNQNNPLLGHMHIQKEQVALQNNLVHNLGSNFKVVSEHWVARHHFPLGLMQRNENK